MTCFTASITDSWQSVEAYRDVLEQVPAEFAKPAAAVLELL